MVSEESDKAGELVEILDRFDESVKGKFERCAHNDWCVGSGPENVATGNLNKRKEGPRAAACGASVRLLCKNSRFARKVAFKLASIKPKLVRKVKRSAKKCRSVNKVDTEIAKGSNTPASSRPSSISMTMDQIDAARWKHSGTYPGETGNSCSISVGSS